MAPDERVESGTPGDVPGEEGSTRTVAAGARTPGGRPERAVDRAARVVREALATGPISFRIVGSQVFLTIRGGTEILLARRASRSNAEVRRRLRDLHVEVAGEQPSDASLRAMFDTVYSAAEKAAQEERARADAVPPPEPATATAGDPGEDEPEEGSDAVDASGPVVFERESCAPVAQRDMIVQLADELGVELWHTPSDEIYATTQEGPDAERAEHRPVGSRDFRRWLQRKFYARHEKAPRREALSEALGVLEGRALAGPVYEIYVRLAHHAGSIYLDLGDAERHIVEIGPGGWIILTKAPVRFRRPAGMLPLPVPMSGGSIEALRPLANVPDDDGWILLVGFVLGSLHPRGPFAVLVLLGEAGSAKSTMARIIVALLDPKDAPLRRPPREERDLAIAARHGRVVAFNNLSRIPDYLSDAICSIATDGGSVFRTLYTDEEETRFSERRPVLLNGIADFVARGDLADRSIKLTLSPIPPESRRTEADVLADLERLRPRILGALLDAVVAALRNEPFLTLPQVPRLADFARWVVAAEPSLGWKPGTFLAAYRRAIGASSAAILEDSLVARSIAKLVANKEWNGSATSLLAALSGLATEEERKSKTWPATPRALSGEIRRLAPDLRRVGYTVDDSGRDAKTRRVLWRIEAPSRTGADKDPSDPSHPSEPPGTPGGSAWRAEGSAAGDAPAPPPGASDASQRSVSDPDRGVVGPAVDSHGSPSEASEGAERPGPSPSEAPRCATCGRTSPYEGRHIENCPACGPSCPCVTCAKRPGGDDA
jgi:hypothetical protein